MDYDALEDATKLDEDVAENGSSDEDPPPSKRLKTTAAEEAEVPR